MFTTYRTSTIRRSVTVLVALVALTAGCEKKIGDVCSEKCASSADAKTCSDAQEQAEATAEQRGCESEFENFASCAGDHAVCTNGVLDAGASCAAQVTALNGCVK